MKKSIFFGVGIATLMLGTTACGGGEEESTEEGTEETTETTEEVVEAVNYTVDAENSVINWTAYHGEEVGHEGTVTLLDGSYTVEGDVITGGSLTVDMNSITSDAEKLTGHLMAPDFFDVNQFATSSFTVDSHADGMLAGKLNVAGLEMGVEAPVSLEDGNVTVNDFKLDMIELPFFQTEREEAPEEEWHDTNIGFTASIVATVE